MNQTKKALQLIRQGLALVEKGDAEKASLLLHQAWHMNMSDAGVLTAVAGTLADLGRFDETMTVLQEAVEAQGETAIICKIMGKMALRMDMLDIAEKALVKSIQLYPDDDEVFADLASCLVKKNKFDDAKGILDIGIERLPKSALLQDAMGTTILSHTGDRFDAMPFHKAAVQLESKNAAYLHNLALDYYLDDEAEPLYRKALRQDKSNPQLNVSFAIFLLQKGKIPEAWRYYRYRLNPLLGPNKTARYTHGIKEWRGGDIHGKSLLICSEQGIGDEIFFGACLPSLQARANQLYIGCDPRLKDIYVRSFPGAVVESHQDTSYYQYRERSFPAIEHSTMSGQRKIDYACTVGSAFSHVCRTIADFRTLKGGFLKPRTDLVKHFEGIIKKKPGRMTIGLSWRSGKVTGNRHSFYGSVDMITALAERFNADFYILQYSMNDEEQAALKGHDNLHTFEDIDLKQNIEANLAIMSLLDMSIGPPTAVQTFAMAVGCPVWLFSQGLPWVFFGEKTMQPLYAEGSRLFLAHDLRFEKKSYLDAISEALIKTHSGERKADVPAG